MAEGNERLTQLAASVRECFCAEYRAHERRRTFEESTYGLKPLPQWDGGVSHGGRRTRSVWEKVAVFVLKHKMDYRVLIQAVFDDRFGEGLTPLALMTAEALALYAAELPRNASPRVQAARDGGPPRLLHVIPTGFDPMDTLMDGGWAPGEVYGIVNTFDFGKTMLAIQLLYQGALAEERYAAKLLQEYGVLYEPGHWLLFHYEEGQESMRNHLVCHAALVDRDSLDHYHPVRNPLSVRGKLKSYELALFKPEIDKFGLDRVDGEAERVAKVIKLINKRIHLIDMSCFPGALNRGTGGPAEIAALLAMAKTHGLEKLSGVFIDHVGLCARRYMRASGGTPAYLRHGVADFGDEMRRLVALPRSCCVWCMNWLNGEANKMSPHKPANSADAVRARNFAENMSFVFALGSEHEESACCLLSRLKSCRAGSMGSRVIPVRLEGSLGRFVSITGGAAAE